MKSIVRGSVVVCVSVISIVLMFTGISYARVDRGSVAMLWLFDEGKGETVKDSSGNEHDGEIKGNVKWVEGKFGGAVSFPGASGSLVKTLYKESLNLEKWSITMWVELEDNGSWQYTFTKEGPQDTRGFFLLTDDKGTVYIGFAGGGKWAEITSRTKVYDSKWHHLAATYDKEKPVCRWQSRSPEAAYRYSSCK